MNVPGHAISAITFETAALADVIKKAEKIAPRKGAAFDKAAGIVLEFNPAAPVPLAVVRVTNLELFSMEWVNVSEWAGEAAVWRLPSALLAHMVGSLPIGSGKTVTMHSEPSGLGQIIHLTSGRTKVKFHPIDVAYYPMWGAFEPDKLYPAPDLGGRIAQVEWVCGTDARFAGVYLDGQYATATDSIRLARVPLSIPDLPNPIVIPAGVLGSVLRPTGEIQIGSNGRMLHIMPDDYTQMKSVIFDVKYPNVSRVTDMPFDSEAVTSRDALLEVMNRVNAFSVGDRASSFQLFFGKGEIAIYMRNEQIGEIGDIIEVPGYADHERFRINFTPKNLIDALSKSPNDVITLHYNEGATKGIIKIDGGSGYEAWVMSRAGDDR